MKYCFLSMLLVASAVWAGEAELQSGSLLVHVTPKGARHVYLNEAALCAAPYADSDADIRFEESAAKLYRGLGVGTWSCHSGQFWAEKGTVHIFDLSTCVQPKMPPLSKLCLKYPPVPRVATTLVCEGNGIKQSNRSTRAWVDGFWTSIDVLKTSVSGQPTEVLRWVGGEPLTQESLYNIGHSGSIHVLSVHQKGNVRFRTYIDNWGVQKALPIKNGVINYTGVFRGPVNCHETCSDVYGLCQY